MNRNVICAFQFRIPISFFVRMKLNVRSDRELQGSGGWGGPGRGDGRAAGLGSEAGALSFGAPLPLQRLDR